LGGYIVKEDQFPTTQIEFGEQKVDVPKGGYYDRYRMNPNLDEVARDPAVGKRISSRQNEE
jgi:hypothetical protein